MMEKAIEALIYEALREARETADRVRLAPSMSEDNELDLSALLYIGIIAAAVLAILLVRSCRRRQLARRRQYGGEPNSAQTSTPAATLVELASAPSDVVLRMDELERRIEAPHQEEQAVASLDSVTADWTRLLGRGGAGAVYLGSWLGTPVAVKVLLVRGTKAPSSDAQTTTSGALNRVWLREEASLLARLRHPCICSVFGMASFEEHKSEAIVLEYLSGGTLHDVLHQSAPPAVLVAWRATGDAPADDTDDGAGGGRRLPMALATRIARETASGLAFLHTQDCVHRDIKPTNILLDGQCHAKVSDFGVATHCHSLKELDGVEAPPVGTLRWMAPEVAQSMARGDEDLVAIGPASDVYSFGVLLWEVVHEQVPFAEFSAEGALLLATRGERPALIQPSDGQPLSAVDAGRARFDAIIAACWEQDPARRPEMTTVVQSLLDLELGKVQAPLGAGMRIAKSSTGGWKYVVIR